jgi:hypothetical protein
MVPAASAFPTLAQNSYKPSAKKGFCGRERHFLSQLNCSWYYNWRLVPFRSTNIPFYPMCWGWKPDTPNQLAVDLVAAAVPILFAFNEPDSRNQANLSVPQALEAWPVLERRAKHLVGPSCVAPAGRWMQQFMIQAERRGLRVDSVGFHSYTAPSFEPFVRKLEAVYKMYGRPIWVTELGVADWQALRRGHNRYSVEQTLTFMTKAVDFLEQTSWIEGYCWFSGGVFGDSGPLSTSAFFDAAGKPSPIATAYAKF